MLAGVSARKYARVGDPVGEEVERESRSTGKSTISERFIERTKTALEELMSRRLDGVRLAVMMLDGIDVAERTHVVALGITTDRPRAQGAVADHQLGAVQPAALHVPDTPAQLSVDSR